MKKLEEYVRSIPDFPEKGIVHVEFLVHTIFGDMKMEREVNY